MNRRLNGVEAEAKGEEEPKGCLIFREIIGEEQKSAQKQRKIKRRFCQEQRGHSISENE